MSQDWKKQISEKIVFTQNAFAELETFFREADKEIADNPADPREGISFFPGLYRLMPLLPCVFSRLEKDIKNTDAPASTNTEMIQVGLEAINKSFESILIYYRSDDVDKAVTLISQGLTLMQKCANTNPSVGIRFFRDLARIAPDFRILLNMFEGFRENRKRRPAEPEADEHWSVQRWLEYYREQARLEEVIISVAETEGLSEEVLQKGMQLMMEESEQLDRRMEETVTSYNLMRNRDAVFNDEKPELFLDLAEIPEIKDADDGKYQVKAIDLRYEENEPSESWAVSLPELARWNDGSSDDELDESGSSHPEFTKDPVYRLLDPFVHQVMKDLKDDYLQQVKEIPPEKRPMRSAAQHYLILLALKSQVRISSCGVWVEEVGHDAPKKGAYLFAIDCVGKIAQTIEKLELAPFYHLAREAKKLKAAIKELL